MDADWHRLPVDLFPGDAFDVDDIFETIYGGDFALAAFDARGAAGNDDFVVFANGDRADL